MRQSSGFSPRAEESISVASQATLQLISEKLWNDCIVSNNLHLS